MFKRLWTTLVLIALLAVPVVAFAQTDPPPATDWLGIVKMLLGTIAVPLITIVVGFAGTKWVNTNKRRAIAGELGEAAGRVLNAVRLNNPGVPLLDNIEYYRKQAFDALVGDPDLPTAKMSKPKSAMDAVGSAIADALKGDTDLGGAGHFPKIPPPQHAPRR